jgi:hypothetical protein
LKNSNYIKRFLAAIFLLLFCFCVTPKRFLHDLLANHKDTQNITGHPAEQIAASGFHCNVDELVVVAPFIPEIQTAEYPPISSTPVLFSEPLFSIVYLFLPQTDGRGPPASFCAWFI